MPGSKLDINLLFETIAKIIGEREGVSIKVVSIVERPKKEEARSIAG
jgi:hypothetical protein